MTSPQWSGKREPNLDSEVEALVRDVMGAVDDLRTARIQLENLDVDAVMAEPTLVDPAFMSVLASGEGASPALIAYAARVAAGECMWEEIEAKARPFPPEVADLKGSPRIIWQWSIPEPSPEFEPIRPQNRNPGVVGPSDWPDDLDDYPDDGKSWLV